MAVTAPDTVVTATTLATAAVEATTLATVVTATTLATVAVEATTLATAAVEVMVAVEVTLAVANGEQLRQSGYLRCDSALCFLYENNLCFLVHKIIIQKK